MYVRRIGLVGIGFFLTGRRTRYVFSVKKDEDGKIGW